MIRQNPTAVLCLAGAVCFAHFVASVWSYLVQFNFAYYGHPDERTGVIWGLSRTIMHVTSWPILAPTGFGDWLHRLSPLNGLAVCALNSILAIALAVGIGVVFVRSVRRRRSEPK